MNITPPDPTLLAPPIVVDACNTEEAYKLGGMLARYNERITRKEFVGALETLTVTVDYVKQIEERLHNNIEVFVYFDHLTQLRELLAFVVDHLKSVNNGR